MALSGCCAWDGPYDIVLTYHSHLPGCKATFTPWYHHFSGNIALELVATHYIKVSTTYHRDPSKRHSPIVYWVRAEGTHPQLQGLDSFPG